MKTIKRGDFIKFRLISSGITERVWGIVTEIGDDSLSAKIDNHPVGEGFALGDVIEGIPLDYILDYRSKADDAA